MKKGFTIIEVVLVLAVAGLIFMIIFLALPALQRAERDNERKQEASRILAAINEYKSNNKGKRPKKWDDLKSMVQTSGIIRDYFYYDINGSGNMAHIWNGQHDEFSIYTNASCLDMTKYGWGGYDRGWGIRQGAKTNAITMNLESIDAPAHTAPNFCIDG